ncbi:MAG: cytochrome P450 [Chloroflexota bacterium]
MTRSTLNSRSWLEDLEKYRKARDTEPVARDPKTGIWNVFRYQDVATVLADHRTFSSDFREVLPNLATFGEGNIVAMDPPRHHQLRGLVSQAFTPRAIARLEARVEELTEELLDRTVDRAEVELVAELAYPLPVTVIAELLGVPAADRPRFKVWADALLEPGDANPNDAVAMKKATDQIRNFHEYLGDHVADRRIRSRADLLGDLVTAEVDGQRLSDPEIVGFATILLLAGHVTTTALLGNAVLCLDEHPDAQATLRADPAAIPMAIEEVLRYRSPVAQTTRVTTAEVELGGQLIPARQLLNLWLLSANHDECQFDRPDEFLIGRHPNPHLGFGKGIHFCIGAPLARLESRIALDALLGRYSRIRVDPAYPLEPYADPGFNGTRTLHLQVERA